MCGHTLSHAPPYILAAALGVSWREGNQQVRTPHVLKSMPHGEYFASKERPHLFMLFVCCLPAGARWLYTVFLPIQNTRLMGPASAGMGAGDGGGCLSSPCWWSCTNAPMHGHPARHPDVAGCSSNTGSLAPMQKGSRVSLQPRSRREVGSVAVQVPLNGSGGEESPAPEHRLPLGCDSGCKK